MAIAAASRTGESATRRAPSRRRRRARACVAATPRQPRRGDREQRQAADLVERRGRRRGTRTGAARRRPPRRAPRQVRSAPSRLLVPAREKANITRSTRCSASTGQVLDAARATAGPEQRAVGSSSTKPIGSRPSSSWARRRPTSRSATSAGADDQRALAQVLPMVGDGGRSRAAPRSPCRRPPRRRTAPTRPGAAPSSASATRSAQEREQRRHEEARRVADATGPRAEVTGGGEPGGPCEQRPSRVSATRPEPERRRVGDGGGEQAPERAGDDVAPKSMRRSVVSAAGAAPGDARNAAGAGGRGTAARRRSRRNLCLCLVAVSSWTGPFGDRLQSDPFPWSMPRCSTENPAGWLSRLMDRCHCDDPVQRPARCRVGVLLWGTREQASDPAVADLVVRSLTPAAPGR